MRSVNNEALLQLEAAVLKAFDEAVDEENRCWNVVDEALKLKLTRTQIGQSGRPVCVRMIVPCCKFRAPRRNAWVSSFRSTSARQRMPMHR